MKTPHLILTGLAALFLAALAFDRPRKPVETPQVVEIVYWEKWTGFEGEAMRATVDLFNSKKIRNAKGQVIHCRCLTTANVNRKTLLAIAGGQPPDVAGLWARETHTFADMNALADLTPFIDADAGFGTARYLDVFWRLCNYQRVADNTERVWCLPTTPATVALHWNKDLFKAAGLDPEQPPRTLAELEEFARKLEKRDDSGKLIQIGFLPTEPGWWNWAWGYYFGGKLNDGPDKITANDPKNIEAWNWLLRFSGKDAAEAEALQSWKQGFGSFDSPQNAFLSGKVAMVQQGVWMANFIRFHNPRMNWGCAAFPSTVDGGGAPVTIADMDVIVIPRGSPHPEEAWELLKFINSKEGMEFLCGGVNNNGGQGKLTPFNEVDPRWLAEHKHPQLSVFIELARSKNAVFSPRLAVWEEYSAELAAAFENVWLKKLTPKEALDAVQARMQPKLDRALEQLK
jgi:ABC-type glycerol-3-phosphate transport system substrate-binding protein